MITATLLQLQHCCCRAVANAIVSPCCCRMPWQHHSCYVVLRAGSAWTINKNGTSCATQLVPHHMCTRATAADLHEAFLLLCSGHLLLLHYLTRTPPCGVEWCLRRHFTVPRHHPKLLMRTTLPTKQYPAPSRHCRAVGQASSSTRMCLMADRHTWSPCQLLLLFYQQTALASVGC